MKCDASLSDRETARLVALQEWDSSYPRPNMPREKWAAWNVWCMFDAPRKEETMEPHFDLDDLVRKVGGDYTFEGTVVGVVIKLSGEKRYVVEDDRGLLHIYRGANLEGRDD